MRSIRGLWGVCDRVLNGDFNGDEVMDEVRNWVTENIYSSKKCRFVVRY